MGSQQPGGSCWGAGSWWKQRVSKSAQSICSQVTAAWRGWALCRRLHCLLRKWLSWGKRKKASLGLLGLGYSPVFKEWYDSLREAVFWVVVVVVIIVFREWGQRSS